MFTITERHSDEWGSRYWQVLVGGTKLFVGVERGGCTGRRYGRIGHKWFAIVRDAQGKELFGGRCDKGTGLKRILICAGLVPCDHTSSIAGWGCRVCGRKLQPDGTFGRAALYAEQIFSLRM